MDKAIEQLFVCLDTIVGMHGMTYNEKREAVLAAASEIDNTNLHEFASWFEVD